MGQLIRAFGQWPVALALAGLILLARIFTLPISGAFEALSWGEVTALVISLVFLLLLESILLTVATGLPDTGGSPARFRLLDIGKSFLYAGLVTLALVSLAKLVLVGTELQKADLWFLTRNMAQLIGEASRLEIVLALTFLMLFIVVAGFSFIGLRRCRDRRVDLPGRAIAMLALLALIGAAVPIARYPAVRASAPRLAPELRWLGLRAEAAQELEATMSVRTSGLGGPPQMAYEPAQPTLRPNVLIVMLESVPQNIMDAPEAPIAIPNLLALGSQSVRFERAYAPSVHSDYAQMAILSSLHPRKFEQHDYYGRLFYPRALVWDALHAAGWRTGMFSCQNEGWGNMIDFLRTPGLDVLRHSVDWPNAPKKGEGSETKVFEETVVEAWEQWLGTPDEQPWMAYLNFQATHFSYEIPEDAARPFLPDAMDFPASFLSYPGDKIPVVRNRYLNALHYSDLYLGEIRRILEERNEWDDTVVVVVSDHGEAFYEHGFPTHGTTLHEEQVRSLMMVRIPEVEARSVEEPVSLMDLAPSLLEILGLPKHGNFQGRSDVFEAGYSADGRPFFFTIQGITDEDGILLDDWKYIVNWRSGKQTLYDLGTDPGELVDLDGLKEERSRILATELGRFLARQLTYYEKKGWKRGRYPEALP